jgi:CRP-like cAMP-binding protein
LGLAENIDVIKDSNYFDGLSNNQLAQIAALATTKRFSRGQDLILEADQGEQVFFITEGRVDISVSLIGTAEKESIATIGTGEMVGEMILLGKKRRSANVTAKDNVSVLVWHGEDLNKLFQKDSGIGFVVMRNVARHMAERLISANQVLRNALTLPNNQVF